MLDENHHLIQCIMDYQSKGKTAECTQYQQILHRNLVYLATIADSNQNMQSLLPAVSTSATVRYIYCVKGKCSLILLLITVSKPFFSIFPTKSCQEFSRSLNKCYFCCV
uniref:SS18 N-terminal domain-containing protein n=1 Tax=Apteryx owenii TaxID=8824 RepID=A0A8B9NW96_APTOW